AQLREAADSAATGGDFTLAVIEQFRATVRALEERGLLETTRGMTAMEVAGTAARVFPQRSEPLHRGARSFNEALYGNQPATHAQYIVLRDLERDLQDAQPARAMEPAWAPRPLLLPPVRPRGPRLSSSSVRACSCSPSSRWSSARLRTCAAWRGTPRTPTRTARWRSPRSFATTARRGRWAARSPRRLPPTRVSSSSVTPSPRRPASCTTPRNATP